MSTMLRLDCSVRISIYVTSDTTVENHLLMNDCQLVCFCPTEKKSIAAAQINSVCSRCMHRTRRFQTAILLNEESSCNLSEARRKSVLEQSVSKKKLMSTVQGRVHVRLPVVVRVR